MLSFFQNIEVDHIYAGALVAKQFLYSVAVLSVFEKIHRKGVPENMVSRRLDFSLIGYIYDPVFSHLTPISLHELLTLKVMLLCIMIVPRFIQKRLSLVKQYMHLTNFVKIFFASIDALW